VSEKTSVGREAGPEPAAARQLEGLLFACLEADDFAAELRRLCAAHPALAARLRRVARRLAPDAGEPRGTDPAAEDCPPRP
jgi:hypothetical protein